MTPSPPLIASYGRRRGRPLRAGRAALMDKLLPRLTISTPPADATIDPATLFAHRPTQVWLEIGFGRGEHLAQQAEMHREVGLIGAEPYLNGVAGLLARIESQALDNIRLWPGDIRVLLPSLLSSVLSRVFVLFPDPWPKARHHKRRLIVTPLISELARVMAQGAELRIATDDPDYLAHINECMAGQAAFQPIAGARPADWPATRYEAKAEAAGRHSAFLRFTRNQGR